MPITYPFSDNLMAERSCAGRRAGDSLVAEAQASRSCEQRLNLTRQLSPNELGFNNLLFGGITPRGITPRGTGLRGSKVQRARRLDALHLSQDRIGFSQRVHGPLDEPPEGAFVLGYPKRHAKRMTDAPVVVALPSPKP